MDNIIYFFNKKKEYRSLSNFFESDIIIIDNVYETGEHCFHGEKYIRLSQICKDPKRKEILLNYGLTFCKPSKYKNGYEAKKNGGKKGLILNENEIILWSKISIIVQKEICKYKLDHYQQVKNDLVKSKEFILIHSALRCRNIKDKIYEGKAIISNDKIEIIGQNLLGNIWMELRK